jgi:hypothetical protein
MGREESGHLTVKKNAAPFRWANSALISMGISAK